MTVLSWQGNLSSQDWQKLSITMHQTCTMHSIIRNDVIEDYPPQLSALSPLQLFFLCSSYHNLAVHNAAHVCMVCTCDVVVRKLAIPKLPKMIVPPTPDSAIRQPQSWVPPSAAYLFNLSLYAGRNPGKESINRKRGSAWKSRQRRWEMVGNWNDEMRERDREKLIETEGGEERRKYEKLKYWNEMKKEKNEKSMKYEKWNKKILWWIESSWQHFWGGSKRLKRNRQKRKNDRYSIESLSLFAKPLNQTYVHQKHSSESLSVCLKPLTQTYVHQKYSTESLFSQISCSITPLSHVRWLKSENQSIKVCDSDMWQEILISWNATICGGTPHSQILINKELHVRQYVTIDKQRI